MPHAPRLSLRLVPAALVLVAAGLFALAAFAREGEGALQAHLTGAAERPAPGDPDGDGHASFRIDSSRSQVCYELSVANIATATAAHVHKAPPAENGPPVITLTAPGADGRSSGCAAADKALVKDLLENPGGYYVNVHNAQHAAGAVRGQLGSRASKLREFDGAQRPVRPG